MDSESRVYALVRWTIGEDAGKYSSDVSTEKIKDFSVQDFKDNIYDPEEEFAIKWPDKEVTFHMAQIIDVSGKNIIFFLLSEKYNGEIIVK